MKRAAVLFPGIGYTTDRPLLYYTARLARETGREVIRISLGNVPEWNAGGTGLLMQRFEAGIKEAEAELRRVDWAAYDDIVFVGKSLGAAVAGMYAELVRIKVRYILLAPLAGCFRYRLQPALCFHGTADPWAEAGKIRALCRENGIPLVEIQGADHALETGHARQDLKILEDTMEQIRVFLDRTESSI